MANPFSFLLHFYRMFSLRRIAFIAMATLTIAVIVWFAYEASHFKSPEKGILHQAWIWVIASVPAILILQHGLYLNFLGPAAFKDGQAEKDSDLGQQAQMDTYELEFPRAFSTAGKQVSLQYGTSVLSVDYFIPTVLNAVIGCILAYVICWEATCCGALPPEIQKGIRYGGIGAFVYVVVMLSTRSFQRDVSTGAAIWSAVQMVLGPILGGLMGTLLDKGVQVNEFNREVFYFFAGLAPRQIITIVEDVMRRFWSQSSSVSESRLVPLTRLRGVTSQIEDRFAEEGISDAFLLAMANPVRLSRNTPFDDRQILT